MTPAAVPAVCLFSVQSMSKPNRRHYRCGNDVRSGERNLPTFRLATDEPCHARHIPPPRRLCQSTFEKDHHAGLAFDYIMGQSAFNPQTLVQGRDNRGREPADYGTPPEKQRQLRMDSPYAF